MIDQSDTSSDKHSYIPAKPSNDTQTTKQLRGTFRSQFCAFLFTAFLFGFIHSMRTVWGYSKPYLASSNSFFSSGKLGILDFAFTITCAIGQYSFGYVGERVNLKLFIILGAFCAVTGVSLFGYLEGIVHLDNIVVDVLLFILNGLGQSTGYPASVSIMNNWFSPEKRGIIFGLWGTNLNIGNIVGQQIGRISINEERLDWQYPLFFTSGALAFIAINLIIFVKVHPKELRSPNITQPLMNGDGESSLPTLPNQNQSQEERELKAISFLAAWKIMNVPFYACGAFCIKGVYNGVIFWLPFYLKNEVGLTGDISLLLASIEIGMVVGSFILGVMSDRVKSRSMMIVTGFFFAVIFLLLIYFIKGDPSKVLYFALLFCAGLGMGGANSLVGATVSSELGQKLDVRKGIGATATLSGIMEGSGAFGAAVTQLFVSNFTSLTFPYFAGLCFLGGSLITPVAVRDYKRLKHRRLYPHIPVASEISFPKNSIQPHHFSLAHHHGHASLKV